MSMERAVGGLRGQGVSTRNGGAPVILQLRNFGNPIGPHAVNGDAGATQGGVAVSRYDTRTVDAVLMIVCFSVDIVCRTGSCEVRE